MSLKKHDFRILNIVTKYNEIQKLERELNYLKTIKGHKSIVVLKLAKEI